jgi:hypothetical protein
MDEGVDVFVNLCDGTPDDALSGIALGLFQMTSLRKNHPSSCNANANRQGIPIKSFGLSPSGVGGRVFIALAGFFLSLARYPRLPLV